VFKINLVHIGTRDLHCVLWAKYYFVSCDVLKDSKNGQTDYYDI